MCATVWNSASSRLVPASSLHPCSWAAPSGLCCLSCAAAPTSPNALSLNPTLQMHPCHFVVLLTCRLAYNIHLMLHQQRHRNQPAAKAWPHGPISLMRNRAGGVACRPDSLVQQCRGAQLVVIKLQPEAGQGRAGQGRAGQQGSVHMLFGTKRQPQSGDSLPWPIRLQHCTACSSAQLAALGLPTLTPCRRGSRSLPA